MRAYSSSEIDQLIKLHGLVGGGNAPSLIIRRAGFENYSRHRSFDAGYCTATIAENAWPFAAAGLFCQMCSKHRAAFMSTGPTAFRPAPTGDHWSGIPSQFNNTLHRSRLAGASASGC